MNAIPSSTNDLHPISPTTQLLRLIVGNWVSQSVYVAAKLGIADRIEAGPMSAADLARDTESNPDVLYRMLRMLCRVGVFAEDEQQRFTLTPVGAGLRSGGSGALRNFSIAMGEELYRAWGDPMHSVKTGEAAFAHVLGASPFEYRASRPEAAETFNQAMTEWSNEATAAILAAYDFSQFSTIADLGGGHGMFLAQLLLSNPRMTGKLFELPYVASGAKQRIAATGIASRCEVIAGDLFADPLPKGVDAYILKNTIESFETSRAEALLKRCRTVMSAGTKLLLIGWIIRRDAPLAFGDLFDSHLIVALNGRIRTEGEFSDLCARSGLHLARIIPTNSAMGETILECRVG